MQPDEKSIYPHVTPAAVIEAFETPVGLPISRQARRMATVLNEVIVTLTGEHVSCVRAGFSRRMTIGALEDRQIKAIHHLRSIIAALTKHDNPQLATSKSVVDTAWEMRPHWFEADDHAWKMRAHPKGTAQLEISPHIAWRLNRIVAHSHPGAIASQHLTGTL